MVETTLRTRCYVMFCVVTLGYIMWKTICYVFFLCIEPLDVVLVMVCYQVMYAWD